MKCQNCNQEIMINKDALAKRLAELLPIYTEPRAQLTGFEPKHIAERIVRKLFLTDADQAIEAKKAMGQLDKFERRGK